MTRLKLNAGLVLCLGLLAGGIALGQTLHWNMWAFVAGYWFLLFAKYLICDIPKARKEARHDKS